jgi:hypothetical protein
MQAVIIQTGCNKTGRLYNDMQAVIRQAGCHKTGRLAGKLKVDTRHTDRQTAAGRLTKTGKRKAGRCME